VLNQYIAQTQALLQNPPASTALYTTAQLTSWINLARGQIAGENECIRVPASLSCVVAQRVYNFSAINTTAVSGVGGVFNIKQINVTVGDGAQILHPRSFQWFNQFLLSLTVPNSGQPKVWAQYAQGAAGSIYLDPIPDNTYTLNLDTVCLPVNLVDDSTVEATPYPWTDCVPFFAAYYAYLGAQRRGDADAMFKNYQEFAQRARGMSNSSVLKRIYPQSVDQTLPQKLGVSQGRGGGQ